VGRFERDDNEAAQLPETLGVATEGLRSTIEVEVTRIVEGAKARAAQIEHQALEKSSRLDEESDRRMGAVLAESRARLAVMFTQIDSVEHSLGDAVRSLRTETERLTAELRKAGTEPLTVTEPPAPAEDAPIAEAEPSGPPVAEPPSPASPAAPEADQPDAQVETPQPPDPAVRELIRQQLVSFAKDGRTRADAERMLLRFKQGDQYFDLLDEIYPDETPGRRGLLRRRKKSD
jgi:hypothetical protein